MPLRGGESVGQAYVRIYGDGSSMPHDIRQALEDSEPSVMEAGKRSGNIYSKSFVTEFGKSKEDMFHDIDDAFLDSLDRLSLADDFFKSKGWRDFQKQVRTEFPDEMADAARLAMKKMEAEFRDSGNLEALPARMNRIGIDVRNAQNDILDAYAEQDRQRSKALQLQERDLVRSTATFKNAMKDVAEQVSRLERGLPSDKRSHLHVLLEDLRRLAPTIAENNDQLVKFNTHIEDNSRSLRRAHPVLSRYHRTMDDFGTSIGRLFGKGSRNNFLNFLGSMVGGILKFPTKVLFTIAKGVTEFGQSVSEAFVKAGGGGAGLLAGAGEGFLMLGKTAAMAGGAIIAFGGILLLLGAIIGPIVSIISGLVGILVALASSVLYAAASLISFLPLLIPLAAIIVGVVAAVMDLKGATGELGNTMDQISDKATKLWDRFKTGIGDSEGLSRVLNQANRALANMSPLVDAAVVGFNKFANQIAKEMRSGAFDKFTDRFARFLPHAMRDLGRIFGNVFGGLAGVLTGAIPSANRLLDWLVKITDRFDKWANSKEGQREIKQFLEDAADSAAALGDFLDEAWGFLKKILREGKATGDTIFTNMADDFERWTKWMEAHPDALQDWFKHAEDIASDVGEIVDSMSELIDDLDSADNRKTGSEFLNGVADALRVINDLANGAQLAIHLMLGDPNEAGADLGDLFGFDFSKVETKMVEFFQGIGTRVEFLWDKYAPDLDLGEMFGNIGGAISDFFSEIGRAFSGGGGGLLMIRPNLDLSGITSGVGRMATAIGRGITTAVNRFTGMAGRAANAAGDVAGRVMGRFTPLPGRVLGVVNQMVARFGNLVERIARTIGDLWSGIATRFTSIPGRVAIVINIIVAQFVGLAGRILRAIGDIVIRPRVVMPSLGTANKWPSPSGEDTVGSNGLVPRGLPTADPALRIVASGSQSLLRSAGTGKVVDASGWQIVTPSEDPRIVATEVVNELIARAV